MEGAAPAALVIPRARTSMRQAIPLALALALAPAGCARSRTADVGGDGEEEASGPLRDAGSDPASDGARMDPADGGPTDDAAASKDAATGDACVECAGSGACAIDNGRCGDPARWRCTTDELGGATCSDVDECVVGVTDCEEICVNRRGGFACSCEAGHDLDWDGRTCRTWNDP